MLEKYCPNAKFKDIDVDYDKIFKKRTENYGDFDIIYYFNDELYLIESKYFSDSYTGNTIIGDYNKLFAQKNNYYKHCRGRYDLVLAEPDAIKKYIGASGDVISPSSFCFERKYDYMTVALSPQYVKEDMKGKLDIIKQYIDII